MNFFKRIFFELKDYSFGKFKSDLNAGLVTGIIAIPLSLALASAINVDAIWGLYTAFAAGFVAAVFSGSPYSVSGPAAALSPILAAIVNKYGAEALPLIGLIAGIILFLFGILKLGKFIKYVPLSVTLGFTAGVAIVLFFGQLNNFLGLTGTNSHLEHFHEKVIDTIKHLNTANLATLLIGSISLLILILMPKIKLLAKIPSSLVAVGLGTLIVYMASKYSFLGFFESVSTLGDKYSLVNGFPSISIPDFTNVLDYVGPAFKIAFLIAVESLLCAVVADKMTRTKHKSNQELMAQGAANIISPIFGGIPSTAVIARTGTNIKNGAQTRIAAIVHSVVVLLFVLFLAESVGTNIPQTVLSAVLLITAWKISEQKEIRHLMKKSPREDIVILFLTMGLTVFLDLTIAVAVGMFLSVLIIFRKLSTIHAEEITPNSVFASESLRGFLKENKDIMFINLEGNLSMGSSASFIQSLHIHKNIKKIIFRMKEIQSVDLSGLEVLEEAFKILREKNIEIYITTLNPKIAKHIKKFGIDSYVEKVFTSTNIIPQVFNK